MDLFASKSDSLGILEQQTPSVPLGGGLRTKISNSGHAVVQEPSEAIQIEVSEKLSVHLERDGGLKQMEVNVSFRLLKSLFPSLLSVCLSLFETSS